MQLMTTSEVAQVLCVSPRRVHEMVRMEILPAVRLGRQVRIDRETLRDWISKGGRPLARGWRGTLCGEVVEKRGRERLAAAADRAQGSE